MSHRYDILIVGGGTAGLTAAIYAQRAGKHVLILEGGSFGGQIVSSPLVENYPGLPAMRGSDYAQALLEQARALGAETENRKVRAAVRTADGFQVNAGKKTFEGRALILATGVKHRHLGLAREEELTGRGISYCATCDGAFFAGQDTAVVGGGDSALQSAIYLAGICRTVYVIHRRNELRGAAMLAAQAREKANLVFRLSQTVDALEGEQALSGVWLRDTVTGQRERLEVTGLFVAVGQMPDNQAFADLAELDTNGYFISGEGCSTRTPGVFVAGDCRVKGLRQLTTAAADGSVAATAACQWLG